MFQIRCVCGEEYPRDMQFRPYDVDTGIGA